VDHRLLSFDTALSMVLSEIIENDFLDPPSKKSIIDLIESSRQTAQAGDGASGGQARDETFFNLAVTISIPGPSLPFNDVRFR
jgi:hypothetical protein